MRTSLNIHRPTRPPVQIALSRLAGGVRATQTEKKPSKTYTAYMQAGSDFTESGGAQPIFREETK